MSRNERTRTSAAPASDAVSLAAVYTGISDYYTAKVSKFGATPLGVDWTCVPTQELRFVRLLKICDFASAFSLNDLGCGYGALLFYLDRRHARCKINYLGIDLSQAMLRHARRLWRDRLEVSFAQGHEIPRLADYSVASGIFNVQLDQPRDVWERFIAKTLEQLHQSSRCGFSVNFIRAPGASISEREGIYSTQPEKWQQYCVDRFGTTTEIISGYGLREFTLMVRNRPVST